MILNSNTPRWLSHLPSRPCRFSILSFPNQLFTPKKPDLTTPRLPSFALSFSSFLQSSGHTSFHSPAAAKRSLSSLLS